MNERDFDTKLEKKLPMVALDEKGRWFCAIRHGDGVQITFFDSEDAARDSLEEYKRGKRSSN